MNEKKIKTNIKSAGKYFFNVQQQQKYLRFGQSQNAQRYSDLSNSLTIVSFKQSKTAF